MRFHGDRSRQIALGHRSRNFGDRPHLIRQVCSQTVDVVRQIAPRAGRARNVRLSAQLALDADLARDRSHLIGKDCQRVGHVVDGIGQLGNFALGFDCQLAFQIAVGHCGNDAGDAAHLISQVACHRIHIVGQVFPGSCDSAHIRLAAELSFGADFTRHAGHFRSERVQLIDHRVNGVLQFQNLTLHVDRDLLREISVGNCRRDVRDVSHLTRQIAGHRIHVVG